jgi:hypothetical protein
LGSGEDTTLIRKVGRIDHKETKREIKTLLTLREGLILPFTISWKRCLLLLILQCSILLLLPQDWSVLLVNDSAPPRRRKPSKDSQKLN